MRCVLRALQQQCCLTLYRLKSTSLSPIYYTRRALCHAPPTPPSAPAIPSTPEVVPSPLCTSSSSSDVALLSLGNVHHVVLRNITSLSRRRQALLWRDLQYLFSCETAARARWHNIKHSNEEVTKASKRSARQPRSVRAAQRMLAMQLATGVYNTSTSFDIVEHDMLVYAQRCLLAVRRMAALLDANATAVLQHCTSMEHLSALQGMAQHSSESSSASSVPTQSVHRHTATLWTETNWEDGATPHNTTSYSSWLTSEEVCAAVEWGAEQLCQLADSLRTTLSRTDNKDKAAGTDSTLGQGELVQCVHVLNEGLRIFMHAITAHILICASLVLRDTAAEKRVGHACRQVIRAVLQCLRVMHTVQFGTSATTSHTQPTCTLPDQVICEALCSQREDWRSALQLAREVCECTTCPSQTANSAKDDEMTSVKVVAHGLSDAAFAILLYCLAQHEGCGELVRQLHTARATSAHGIHKYYIGMSTSFPLALAEANTSSSVTTTKPHTESNNDEEEDALVHVIHNGWLPQRRLSLVEYWQLLRRISMRQRSSHSNVLPWEGMSVRHTQWVLSPAAIWMHSHTLRYEVRSALCLMSFLQARHRTHTISHYGTSQPVSRSSCSSNGGLALSLEDLYVVLRLTRQMREEWLSCLVRTRETVLCTHAAHSTNTPSDDHYSLWWRLAGRRSTAPATSNAFLGELAAAYEDIVHAHSTRKQTKATTTAAHKGFASSFSIMHGMVARELLCLLLHRALCEHSVSSSCHGLLTALRLVMREKEAYMYIAFVPDVVLTRSATCLAVGLARCLGTQPDSSEESNSINSKSSLVSHNARTSYTSLLLDAFVRLGPMLSSFVLASLVQYGPLASLLRMEWRACAALVPYAPLRSRCQLELLLRVARATEGQFGLNTRHTHNDEMNIDANAAKSWQSAALAFLTQPYTTHSHHNTRHSDDDGRYALGLFLLHAGQLSTVQLLACYHRMSVRVQKMTAAHVLRLIVHTAVATPHNSSDYTTERVAFRELMQSEAFAQLVQAALGCDYNSTDTSALTRSSTYSQLSMSVVLVEAVMHTLLQAQMWYEGLRFRQLVQCVRPDLLRSSHAMPDALIHTLHASYVRRIQDHATLLARGLLARSALVDLVARLTRAVNQRRWQDAIRVFTQYIQGDSLCEDISTYSNNMSDEVAVCAMPPVEQRRMRALERQGTVQVLIRELADVGHALRYAALVCATANNSECMDAVHQRDIQLALQYVPIAQLPLPASHVTLLTQHKSLVESKCENELLAMQQPALLTGVSLTGQHTATEEEGSNEDENKEHESETMLLVEWARLHAREERNRAQRSTSTQSPQLYTNTQPSLASQARMLAIQAMMCWPPLLHSALPLHNDNSIASTNDYTSVSEAEVQLLTWLRAALPSQFTLADFTTWNTITDPSLQQQQRTSDSSAPIKDNNTITQDTTSQPALWAEALRCFSQLPSRARPDTATLRAALRACALGAQWQYALQLLYYCTLTRASFDSTISNSNVVSDAAQLALRTAVQAGAWAAALHVAHSYRHTRDPQLVHCLLITYIRVGAASEAIELGYDCLRRRVRLQDRSLQLLLEASQALSAEHAATAHALRSLVTTEEDMYVLSSAMQEHVRQMMQICELPVEPRQLLASVHMHLTTARRELEA